MDGRSGTRQETMKVALRFRSARMVPGRYRFVRPRQDGAVTRSSSATSAQQSTWAGYNGWIGPWLGRVRWHINTSRCLSLILFVAVYLFTRRVCEPSGVRGRAMLDAIILSDIHLGTGNCQA